MTFSRIEDIEKRTFYYLCGFSFFLPLSKPIGNIFFTLAIFGMIHRLLVKNDDVKVIFSEYKKIFSTIAIFLVAVFISALTSADIVYGVKKFLEKYIVHVAAVLPVLFISCDKEKIFQLAKLLLLGVFISNFCVIAQGILHFDEVWRFGGPLTVMAQGTLVAMFLPVYAVSMMHVTKIRLRIFFILAMIVGFLAMIFNGTRGVWLTAMFLVPAVVLIYAKNKLKSLAIVFSMLMIVGGIFAVTPNLHERFSTITDLKMQSNSERLLMWESALKMFEDNPIFGVGYGQYKFAYQNKYISPEAKERQLEHAHNNILQMLAECGIIGVTSFLFLWGYFSYFSLSRWFKDRNFEWLIFFCMLWGMMLHGLTEFNFETSATGKIFWYTLGMCIIYNHIENSVQKLDSGGDNL